VVNPEKLVGYTEIETSGLNSEQCTVTVCRTFEPHGQSVGKVVMNSLLNMCFSVNI